MEPILPISPVTPLGTGAPAGARSGGAFRDALAGAIREVEGLGQEASSSVERFLNGDGEELHNTVMATTRAELSFEMFLQTRNKVVSAYQEIMKMQL